MTTQEFSDAFDTLLNSHSNVSAYGEQSSKADLVLDEYEKSLLLTQAQEEIVRGLYNGTLTGESFEETEELRRNLDSLIITEVLRDSNAPYKGVTSTSRFYSFPEDVWFIIYEQATITGSDLCGGSSVVKVVPMRHDEWHNSSNNPFRRPSKKKVIRLDHSAGLLELVSDYSIIEYLIKYLSKPTPIVLTQLPEGVSIDGEHDITECQLNTALHRIILERAVQLAYKRIPQASK